MATTLNFTNRKQNGVGSNSYDMVAYGPFGPVMNSVVATVSSSTQIQWTHPGTGSSVVEFVSGRSPAGGWTLSGTVTFFLNCIESSMSANCTARARLFKRTSGGSETEVGGGPWNDDVEFQTGAISNASWTGTPSSTAFAEDDRLIVRFYITNAPTTTMGGGFECTMRWGCLIGGGSEPLISLTETVAFKSDAANFGDVVWTAVKTSAAITNPISPTSSALIGCSVGDLILVVVAESGANTSTSCSDNLGNSYTALNGGTNGTGNVKAFYSVVTTAGDATPAVATTASANAATLGCVCYKGPFESSPLDVNTSVVADSTEPYTCNATGTLAQADELIVCYAGGAGSGQECLETAGPTGALVTVSTHGRISNTINAGITSLVVSSTSSVTMEILTTEPGVNRPYALASAAFKAKGARKVSIDTGTFSFAGAAVSPKRTMKVVPATGAFAFAGAAVTLRRGRPLIVTPGSFTFAGQAVTLKPARKVVITAGAFVFAGQDVALERGRKIFVDPGSFVFTGADVTLTKAITARKLIVDAGAFVFAGQNVTFKRTYNVIVTAGAFVFAGQPVFLERGYRVFATATGFVFAGQDVALKRGRKVFIDPGSFAFAGQAVTLKPVRKVVIDQGSFIFAGQEVALKRGYKVFIDPGAFVFAGQAVTLKRTQKIVIDPAGYTFAGEVVNFKRNYRITVDVGTFVFAGQSVGLIKATDRVILLEQGSFIFAGQAVTLKRTLKLVVDIGSFVFSGQDVALKRGRRALIDPGSFVFAGAAVNFKRTYRISITAGAFVFTGAPISLKRTQKIVIDQGNFAFAGAAVTLKVGRKISIAPGAFVFTGQDVALKRGRKILVEPGSFVFSGADITLTRSGVAASPRRGDFFTVMPY